MTLFRLFLCGLFLAPALSFAQVAVKCPEHFLDGQWPMIQVAALANQTQQLCSAGHATMHSSVTRTPLFSASHLTRERIDGAKNLARVDSFREDPRLRVGSRSELSDFARSGFDRGHLAPNGDMADIEQQADSFVLSNIVPQLPDHNRKLWEAIERVTRVMARRYGGAYVVTGASFLGQTQRIGAGVAIPTHIWKAVYFPRRQEAAVWFTPHDESLRYEVITLNELQRLTGVDAIPAAPAAARVAAIALPRPPVRGEH